MTVIRTGAGHAARAACPRGDCLAISDREEIIPAIFKLLEIRFDRILIMTDFSVISVIV